MTEKDSRLSESTQGKSSSSYGIMKELMKEPALEMVFENQQDYCCRNAGFPF
jgi:hypothetical protein